jgi:hypothetical protein
MLSLDAASLMNRNVLSGIIGDLPQKMLSHNAID